MLSFKLELTVKQDSVAHALRSLSEINRRALTHSGVIAFTWFQHVDAPQRFTLIEQWDTQANLDAHVAQILDVWNEFVPCLQGEAVSTRLEKLLP